MNAETATLDLSAVRQFVRFWMEVTDARHITLTSIVPDGATQTRTFDRGDGAGMARWIVSEQAAKRNVYFTPNDTHPDCASKPPKAAITAFRCRFADIDPLDEMAPWLDERARLARLADVLAGDNRLPPTVIIDSGNGIQPLWVVEREPNTPETMARVEAETRSIEKTLGAGGTHNVDRLLRLPGSVNFPNAKKRSKGRGATCARLLFAAPNLYSATDAEGIAKHVAGIVAGTELVRHPVVASRSTKSSDRDVEVTALVRALTTEGADRISTPEHLPAALRERLDAALHRHRRLADRWTGLVDDLTEAGRDASRSGADLSLAAMLKRAEFSHAETALILLVFPHGKARNDEWASANLRLRYAARCTLRSHEPDPKRDPVADLIAEFNSKYFVVTEAGKAIVYEPAHDPVLNRRYHDRILFEDLRRLYLNRQVCIGYDEDKKPILKNAADLWLRHPDRRQFIGGVTFDPTGRHVRPDTLNLWQGFAVQPRPGSWARMRDHIFKVICGSNQGHFDYVMGWMARLVQYPAQQGEVAVVMRGGEGTGKGTLAKALLRIIGQHGLAISNSKHLTGNFNGHLRDVVFLFADEAFFAGDRAHVGVLKALITEPSLTIEAKHQNAIQVPNYTHLMMASNEEWVVPASQDARRFFVLEVLSSRANDHAYFAAIDGEMRNGGYEAMLADLLQYDLTFFNVRDVPVTDGLKQQRTLSLGTSEAWWQDVLHRGYVFQSRLGLEDYFGEWHDTVTTEVLFASYGAYAEKHRERHPMGREALGRFMVRMGSKATRPDQGIVGEHITDVETPHGVTRKADLIRKSRPGGYHLGNLTAARAGFASATKLTPAWPSED